MREKIGQATTTDPRDSMTPNELRWSILEEEQLRRDIAYEEKLRQRAPDSWRVWEMSRRTQNQEKVETNRRLTALGLEPLRLEPSLAQRRQKLQRLERSNKAKIAVFQRRSKESGRESHGTPLARRRARRTDQ